MQTMDYWSLGPGERLALLLASVTIAAGSEPVQAAAPGAYDEKGTGAFLGPSLGCDRSGGCYFALAKESSKACYGAFCLVFFLLFRKRGMK